MDRDRGQRDRGQRDRLTWCGQLTFRDGAQLSHVNHAAFQVLAAVLHLSSSALSSSTCFCLSCPTFSTERRSSLARRSCQKESDPLASLSLCLTRRSLSGSIKAAFWKPIWKGATSRGGGGPAAVAEGERE